MYQVAVTGIVLAIVVFGIVSGKISMLAVGLGVPLVLSVMGVIPAGSAYSSLGSTTNFLIVGAFALGDAFFRVGLTDLVGSKVIHWSANIRNESVKLFIICLLAAVMSAFLSSLGVQVALMTIIISMAASFGISKTKALMALGYAATIGGSWSMIGTTLVVVGKGVYEEAIPGETLGLFEITRLSLPIGLALLLVFCFITSRWIPDRASCSETEAQAKQPKKLGSLRDRIVVACTFVFFLVMITLDGHTPIQANMVSVLVLFILVLSGISTPKEIVDSIRWDVLLFIVAMGTLSTAISSSGLSTIIGDYMLSWMNNRPNPYLVVGFVCVVSAILTQFLSNAGAFGIMVPFLPTLADSLGVSLKPLLMAAMICCTAGFALPISAPSYPMFIPEGKMQIRDWVSQGIVLVLITAVLTTLLVPIVWPL